MAAGACSAAHAGTGAFPARARPRPHLRLAVAAALGLVSGLALGAALLVEAPAAGGVSRVPGERPDAAAPGAGVSVGSVIERWRFARRKDAGAGAEGGAVVDADAASGAEGTSP